MSDRVLHSTWFFAMVLVQRDDRFVLVRERKHGQRWYYPAGRVEFGETLAEAALRETLEEAGIRVELIPIRLWPVCEHSAQLETMNPGSRYAVVAL